MVGFVELVWLKILIKGEAFIFVYFCIYGFSFILYFSIMGFEINLNYNREIILEQINLNKIIDFKLLINLNVKTKIGVV